MNDFIITGVGGQGVITCSKIIATAALITGYDVRSSETIGMAQRGGSVISHIRIGKDIYSPFIIRGQADEVISMDLYEAIRNQSYLKENGQLVAPKIHENKQMEDLKLRSDVNACFYDLSMQWKKMNTQKYTNIILLGIAFCDDRYFISHKDIRKAIVSLYTGKRLERNLMALQLGINIGKGKTDNEGIYF